MRVNKTMIYLLVLFMACCGYYTFTYGISLWRDEKNKLGGFAAAALAAVGTIAPGIVLFMKS